MADITKIGTFIQSSPHPAWLATTQGHCVYANPALERLSGFNSDQINQADWRSFLLEEDRAVAESNNIEYRTKMMLGSLEAGLAFSNASLGAQLTPFRGVNGW